MADKKPAPPTEAAPNKKKKGGKLKIILLLIILIPAVPFILPTMILLAAGMIPTLVALMTDTDRQKSATTAVGAMNIAGIVPFAIDLWVKGQTMTTMAQILTNPVTWLVMLGASGIGWLIVFAVPQAVALAGSARDEQRLKILKSNLASLKESWGPEVGTTKPLEQLEGGP